MDEMTMLRDMLDERGIDWVGHPTTRASVTQSPNWHDDDDAVRWSVACGEFTYGGPELLELWFGRDDEDPCGWLDAEQVVRKIEERLGL